MQCPNCNAKITSRHYDPDYEIFECPGCGTAYEADELEEAVNGTSPRKRRELAAGGTPKAKGKKRQEEISEDEAALARFEAEAMKPRKSTVAVHHRDEVPTRDLLEIVADEVESIWTEFGVKIDRGNAREYFAMNLIRPLRMAGVSFREREISRAYCDDHSA